MGARGRRFNPGHPDQRLLQQSHSGARRLPNGNTLITDGFFGRMFQVTPEGEVVWEYITPYFSDGPLGVSNAVFRAEHYATGTIARL